MKRQHYFSYFCFFSLLVLSVSYFLAYKPVYYVNNVKQYRSYYVQGDTLNYQDYAQREIEHRPFSEWYLKLERSTASVVYFSWLNMTISQLGIPDLVIGFISLLITLIFFNSILARQGIRPNFLAFSILSCFTHIVYMQSITKEVFIFPLLSMVIWSQHTKNYRATAVSLLLLFFVRPQFSIVVLLALAFNFFLGKAKKKVVVAAFLAFAILLPIAFNFVFTSYTVSMNQTYGLYRFYLQALKVPLMPLLWFPFKLVQNFVEPLVAVANLSSNRYILDAPVILELFSSLSALILCFFIFRLRKRIEWKNESTRFILILTGIYFITIAESPIVHFRYLVPFFPLLGLFGDLIQKPKAN